MCGIFGSFDNSTQVNNDYDKRVSRTLKSLYHRGPDDKGADAFTIAGDSLILGHTRLSIIDLSSSGHQPMHTSDDRYCIVFNGEIYNYKELRSELKQLGHVFITDSDTEVLLKSWITWGQACLSRLLGMFAFVIFDRDEGTLTCVRDAFGIKPFYYTFTDSGFYFASELPALLELSSIQRKVDWQRSYDYLVHGEYDSLSNSFIDGVHHLPPASLFTIDLKAFKKVQPVKWWQPDLSIRSSLSFDEATETLRDLFLENVRLHLRSDVAIGAALSGGIDSSSLVCAMRHLEPEIPIKTFSYIANDERISEENWVDEINQFTNAEGYKVYTNKYDLERDLDDMLLRQGEPFGSTSIYAQYRVYQLAKQQGVTVTLDGQGADELLAGYIGYPGHRLLSLIEQGAYLEAFQFSRRWASNPGRSLLFPWLNLAAISLPDGLYKKSRQLFGRKFNPGWLRTDEMIKQGVDTLSSRPRLADQYKGRRVGETLVHSLQKLVRLLRHGDRNSMAFTVESRVPFLTIPMAEFLLSLPEEYLISNKGTTKHVFREAMRGIMPDRHLDRKDKIGFETPESQWLIGMSVSVRKWLEDAPEIPFINKPVLLEEFDKVVSGEMEYDSSVWRRINFVRWYSVIGANG